MGVWHNGWSGIKGTTGVEGFDVITITGIFRTLEQTFIVKSPISRSKTPRFLNSFAFSVNERVVSATNAENSFCPFSSSSTNNWRSVNVSPSSNPDNKLSDNRWSWTSFFLFKSIFDNCLTMLQNAQSPSSSMPSISSPNPAKCLLRSSIWVFIFGSSISAVSCHVKGKKIWKFR